MGTATNVIGQPAGPTQPVFPAHQKDWASGIPWPGPSHSTQLPVMPSPWIGPPAVSYHIQLPTYTNGHIAW